MRVVRVFGDLACMQSLSQNAVRSANTARNLREPLSISVCMRAILLSFSLKLHEQRLLFKL